MSFVRGLSYLATSYITSMSQMTHPCGNDDYTLFYSGVNSDKPQEEWDEPQGNSRKDQQATLDDELLEYLR